MGNAQRLMDMAYDTAALVNGHVASTAAVARTDDFRRGERLVVLMGGAALGILAGLGAALVLGRVGAWPVIIGIPLFVFALYLAVATFRDAVERRAFGCAAAAGLVAASMLAWPAAALLVPMSALTFWIAPTAALGSMALLASCWSGASGAVYRLSGEAAMFCTIVAFLGITQIMT
jgi:hypothetical protein